MSTNRIRHLLPTDTEQSWEDRFDELVANVNCVFNPVVAAYLEKQIQRARDFVDNTEPDLQNDIAQYAIQQLAEVILKIKEEMDACS